MAAFLNNSVKPKGRLITNPTCNAAGDHVDTNIFKTNKAVIQQASGDNLPKLKTAIPNVTQRSGSSKRNRWLRRQEKLLKKAEDTGIPFEVIKGDYDLRRTKRLAKCQPKTLEAYLDLVLPRDEAKHFIDVRLCRSSPMSDALDHTYTDEFNLYSAYQIGIHKDAPEGISSRGFDHFLVDSPLVSERDPQAEASDAPLFGSYHQQYWLDGEKLIAVGVLDILPGCLSSVYLFYDPEYSYLHLGTYTSLREIAFVRHLNRTYGYSVKAYADFTKYYMGYYIHSCVKMRYKGHFSPSFLACPETYRWVPIEICRKLLDVRKYAKFAEGAVDSQRDSNRLRDEGYANLEVLLPNYASITSLLEPGRFQEVDGDKIVMKLGVVASLLTKSALRLVEDWLCLVDGHVGGMRIDLSN